jgi:cyclase
VGHRHACCVMAWCVLFSFVSGAHAQSRSGAAATAIEPVHAVEVAPHFYVISNPAANLVLVTRDDMSFVAGVQRPELVRQALVTLKELKAPPVKYVLLIDDEQAGQFGDGGWGARGAITLAHEALSARLYRTPRADGGSVASGTALPAVGFSQVVQLHLPGEETHIIRQRPGSTDADAVIHFEGSGILYLGPIFTSDGYPRIDAARGGKLSTMIETVDFFVTAFAQEPGHIEPIIPGRGPIATIAQLRDYRDMLRSVHDRVQTLVKAGRPLVDVLAAKPTAEFDARWGHGAVNAEQFVRMVFEVVSQP